VVALCLLFPAAVQLPSGGATPEPPAALGSECVDPEPRATAMMTAADNQLRRALPERGSAADRAGSIDTLVKVHVHILRTKDTGGVPGPRLQRQIRILNAAYAGAQSRFAASVPFHFRVVSRDVRVRAQWYRMSQGSRPEARAKRTLHRGGAGDLNIYIAMSPGVLGWTTQPTAYAGQPKMDGIVIARRALPGGGGGRYGRGDALVHESGHWLGLFHTFRGRCTRRGDLVRDTPAEARPSYTCPVHRNTCRAPGRDPVHNFMDYSYDSCLNQFTAGQAARMVDSWQAFRSGGQP